MKDRAGIPTDLGPLGLRWGPAGVREVRWPGDPEAASWPRWAGEGPRWLAEAVEALGRHLQGGGEDLSGVPVDLSGLSDFTRAVLAEVRRIPPGQTRSYGEVAAALGRPRAARAVGQALARNPVPLLVPCHRVVSRQGRLGGFTAPGGAGLKRRLLELERARGIAGPRAPSLGFTSGRPRTPRSR